MDVIDYLKDKKIGYEVRGGKLYIKSLFKPESTPSLCIYPTLTWYDWSTNKYGTIADIMQLLGDKPKELSYSIKHKKPQEFSIFDYIEHDNKNKKLITQYAVKRGIYSGYIPSGFMWENKYYLGMMFVHVDEQLNPSGFKIRAIDDNFKQRFYAKGKLNAYVRSNCFSNISDDVSAWLVESETSAATLYQYLVGKKVVISFGSVGSIGAIPNRYKSLRFKLIIDYDGDEKIYRERLKPYLKLNVDVVKLHLQKGEDINSLYVSGNLHKYI